METKFSLPSASPRTSAAALVMTLITLSILVILLVGFLSTMLTERRAATAFEDTSRAKLIAAGAVSHAIDILRTNIPEPARLAEGPRTAPGENWVVNPGRLTVIEEGQLPRYIPLHTGEVTSLPDAHNPRDAESVDLNQPIPGDTVPAITGLAETSGSARPAMRVKWVNLLRDPAKTAAKDNKLMGRYAFWMDDESARLNINTAIGKPAPGADGKFDAQLKAGFLTPLFSRGTRDSKLERDVAPDWALGRPMSVNLDVLFASPNQFLGDKLLDHVFLLGYSRYPEAILDFTTLQGQAARQWFDRSRYNLTAYSRSPEFNAFNRSRLFTTYVPLSLEAGPNYQQPFVYDPTGAYNGNSSEVLNLNTLLGTFGFTSKVTDEDGDTVDGGNVVNKSQIQMLVDYLHRVWPGYSRSFADKYGDAECTQIALNAALMARMATTQITDVDLRRFSVAYAARSTSVNYSPEKEERKGATPERMYWRFPGLGKNGLFLPQMPGPHITEIRLFVRSADASPAPHGNAAELSGYTRPRYIQYWYEVEYYMQPFGPVVDLSVFPTRMDFFEFRTPAYENQSGVKPNQQFGPPNVTEGETAFDRDWTEPSNLGRLVVAPPVGTRLGPTGSGESNRVVFRSDIITVGQRPQRIPFIEGADYTKWDPYVFDAARAATVSANLRLRPGMSTTNLEGNPAGGRPRQMIPLGETREDTLKATFNVSLLETRDDVVSWQINDPRLSSDLAQWEAGKQGPGNPTVIGTPKLQNSNEPGEDQPEKSKLRYLQRAMPDAKVDGYTYDRSDEYSPSSRVSSPGYWSLLHTGMQSGKPWRTLDFGAEGRTPGPLVGNDTARADWKLFPPDWLLLDLLGPTYPMSNDQWKIDQRQPDEFSTASFMNSTAGQINLNSRIYPRTKYFNPPARRKPLQAVFQNLPGLDAKQIADEIDAYQKDDQVFDYVGEVANVSAVNGSAGSPWKRELALRNMAGVLTTKSNTFGVWGVAQAVKKVPKNSTYDQFEKGDEVVAEKRFYALVERYIWAGRDGTPGNGHVSPGTGKWDRLAIQSGTITAGGKVPDTLFQLPGSPPLFRSGKRLNLDTTGSYAEMDGPERVGMNPYTEVALGKVRYRESTLEDAYNPPQPVIKYRIVSFKYLDQ